MNSAFPIKDDDAYVLRETLEFYVDDASSEHDWNWSRELRRFKKESGEWKYYGVHLGLEPPPTFLNVFVRNTFELGEHNVLAASFFDCEIVRKLCAG